MRVTLGSLGLVALASALMACTTSGTGSGTLRNGNGTRVTFAWESTDSVSGKMSATFSDGRVFSGSYFQITSDLRIDRLDPLWDGWGRPRRGWPYWYEQPGSEFVTHYSGRVLANMAGSNGEHLRCRFRLVHPSVGMSGGGQGECQFAEGKVIDATFPRS